mgnify:CR=1 FL=1
MEKENSGKIRGKKNEGKNSGDIMFCGKKIGIMFFHRNVALKNFVGVLE